MESEGHKCTSIQGDMDREARDRVVNEFRTGATKILIATDVLARGFDVTQVPSADFTSGNGVLAVSAASIIDIICMCVIVGHCCGLPPVRNSTLQQAGA